LVVGDDVQAERVDVRPGRGLAITSGSVTLISGDAELGGAPMVPGDVTIVPAGETRRFENRGPADVVAIVTTRTGS
jgi:mannose-6-phosphate isomerase-like protein (cupin superfamily)